MKIELNKTENVTLDVHDDATASDLFEHIIQGYVSQGYDVSYRRPGRILMSANRSDFVGVGDAKTTATLIIEMKE